MNCIIHRLTIMLCCLSFVVLSTPVTAMARLQVFVSIPPQKYLVEQIGKNRVNINLMVQPGASPHTYEPRPRQMVAISRTDIYFAIGVEFESVWMKKLAATNPSMKIVKMQQGIEKLPITGHHDEEEHQEKQKTGYDDHHNRLDPHIWLSPRLVKVQAKTVLEALQEADPASRSFYQNNYNRFIKLVSDLDGELTDLFRSKRQARFLVFHPSWGYFAEAYGLKQVAIEIEGKTPKPAQLKRIIEQMREYGIRIIFVQPQFSSKAAKLIARAINGEVVFIDPLSEDWMVNMRQVADKFKRTLK